MHSLRIVAVHGSLGKGEPSDELHGHIQRVDKDGDDVGPRVGTAEGAAVGCMDGDKVILREGTAVGARDNMALMRLLFPRHM